MKSKILSLAKIDFAENKVYAILFTLFILVAPSFLYALINHNTSEVVACCGTSDCTSHSPAEITTLAGKYGEMAIYMLIGISCVIIAFISARTFKSYHSRGFGISTTMLPASKANKFLYLVFRNGILLPLLCALSIQINSVIWTAIMGLGENSYHTTLLEYILHGPNTMGLLLFCYILFMIYLIASITFKKRNFIIGSIITLIFLYFFFGTITKSQSFRNSPDLFMYIAIATNIALLTFVWYRYRKLQIK